MADGARGCAGGDFPTWRRQRLHFVAAGFRAAAEDQHPVAEHGRGGVMKGAAQRRDFAQLSAAAVELEDAADRGFAGVEATDDQRAGRKGYRRLA